MKGIAVTIVGAIISGVVKEKLGLPYPGVVFVVVFVGAIGIVVSVKTNKNRIEPGGKTIG